MSLRLITWLLIKKKRKLDERYLQQSLSWLLRSTKKEFCSKYETTLKIYREEIVENILKKQKEAATKARMVQLRNE